MWMIPSEKCLSADPAHVAATARTIRAFQAGVLNDPKLFSGVALNSTSSRGLDH